jgi:hypothetical protein
MVLAISLALATFPPRLLAESGATGSDPVEPVSDNRSDSYLSVRGSVYKKRLARAPEDGYDASFKLQLSTSIYNYKSLDDLLDEETLHFNSLGVRPTMQLVLPTRWENVSFIPTAEVQLTRRFDLDKTLSSGSVSGQFRYEDQKKDGYLISYGSLKYGTKYDEDGLNQSDYLRLKFKATFNRSLNWSIGEHAQSVIPFGAVAYYLSDPKIGASADNFQKIENEYEIGLAFGSEPRIKFWGVRIPEIQISYTFGDNVNGFKIRF